ncbi:hypothetical protein FF1_030396 [Malus domestica]
MTYGITARVVVGNKRKDMVQEELITAVREGANATGGFELGGSRDYRQGHNGRSSNELEVPITNDNIKTVLRVSIFNFVCKLSSYSCNFCLQHDNPTETSSSTVKWEMSEMLKTPRVMTKAQAEVRQMLSTKGVVVEETGLEELKLCHYTLPFICCFRKNAAKVVRFMDIRYLLSKPNHWSEAKRDS